MNTDDSDNNSNPIPEEIANNQSLPEAPRQDLTNLVNVMQSVDTNTPEAKENATSIDDNNGGRVELNEDIASKIF